MFFSGVSGFFPWTKPKEELVFFPHKEWWLNQQKGGVFFSESNKISKMYHRRHDFLCDEDVQIMFLLGNWGLFSGKKTYDLRFMNEKYDSVIVWYDLWMFNRFIAVLWGFMWLLWPWRRIYVWYWRYITSDPLRLLSWFITFYSYQLSRVSIFMGNTWKYIEVVTGVLLTYSGGTILYNIAINQELACFSGERFRPGKRGLF